MLTAPTPGPSPKEEGSLIVTKTKFVASSLIRAMVEPRLPDWVEAHWYVTKEEAMDVLHTGSVDGFCLVSSDSDFTRLATRIREAGKVVYGFGERKTPEPFVAACDKFIYTEILRAQPEESKPGEATVAELPKLKPILLNALSATAREDGWATLAALGGQINRSHPSFDPRNYGVAKLGELIRQQAAYLEVKEVTSGEGDLMQTHLHVRRKTLTPQKAG